MRQILASFSVWWKSRQIKRSQNKFDKSGREEGGEDATEAGGGNLHSNSDLPIYPDLESLSVPKTPIEKTRQTLFTFY